MQVRTRDPCIPQPSVLAAVGDPFMQPVNISCLFLRYLLLVSGNVSSILSADVLDVKVGCTGNVVSVVQVLASLVAGIHQTIHFPTCLCHSKEHFSLSQYYGFSDVGWPATLYPMLACYWLRNTGLIIAFTGEWRLALVMLAFCVLLLHANVIEAKFTSASTVPAGLPRSRCNAAAEPPSRVAQVVIKLFLCYFMVELRFMQTQGCLQKGGVVVQSRELQ